MIKFILIFLSLNYFVHANECIVCDINTNNKPDKICIKTKKKQPIITITLDNNKIFENKNIIDKDSFYLGRDSKFIDINPIDKGAEIQLSNIIYKIRYVNNNINLVDIKVFSLERPTVTYNGDKGTFVPVKKIIINQPFANFDFKTLKKIYPNKKKSCDILNNLLKIIREKNQYEINDINIYNAIYGCGIDDKYVQKENDLLYFYVKKIGTTKIIANALSDIIKRFPNRTVAYINLGDAYWELGEKQKAIKAYNTYIEQMCHKGLQKKIPKAVLERVKDKR